MEIQVKEVDKCILNVHYEANQEEISAKKDDVVQIFKDAPVPGFRKGKADLSSIRLYYAKQIDEALKRALAEDAFHNALFDQEAKPFGAPEFSSMSLIGKKFSCDFTMRVYPKFDLVQYKGIEIPRQLINFDVDRESEKAIESLRRQLGESIPYSDDDFVQSNDMAIINYEAFDGDTKIEEVSGEGQIILIGQSILPGFDDNLLGMKVNDTRTFYLKIPETGMPSFANKEIKFVVNLVMGSKTDPLPLDDMLAKKAGKNDLAELRDYIVNLVQAKHQEMERTTNAQQLMSRLVQDNKIEVAQWMSLQEAKVVASQGNVKWETLSDTDKEQYLKVGENNVKAALILDKIRENDPECQLSDAEVLNTIDQNLSKGRTKEEVDALLLDMAKSGKLQILSVKIRDEYTIDNLLKNVKWIE